jgi:hypothetical protein
MCSVQFCLRGREVHSGHANDRKNRRSVHLNSVELFFALRCHVRTAIIHAYMECRFGYIPQVEAALVASLRGRRGQGRPKHAG